jgi:hypothetical protein
MIGLETFALPTAAAALVACPEPGCGETALHPVKIVCNAGGEVTVINDQGTTVTEGEPAGRGVEVRCYFHGECGHVSVLLIQFHKGGSYIRAASLGYLCGPPEEWYGPRTIWRD